MLWAARGGGCPGPLSTLATIGSPWPLTPAQDTYSVPDKGDATEEFCMTRCLATDRNRRLPLGARLRWALVALPLLSSLGLITESAWSLPYAIAPGATFDSVSAPSVSLTGSFELAPYGFCTIPCEPDAYRMDNVVLAAGGETLSSGIVEPIPGSPLVLPPAFEILPDESVVTGEFPIQRTITAEGPLTGDPHGHNYFEDFSELLFGPLVLMSGDPREVLFSSPRGEWPIEVTLVYEVIRRTGTALSGNDGSGIFSLPEIVDVQSETIGQVIFTAHPVPEPSTGLLVLIGMLGLGWRRTGSRRSPAVGSLPART
ncbi:MAG TPA: PEP-CTERM sorting domain-containing protein [Myxococcales bacterium]|nr:PEP-CTERM sorting domain-containing protein [Myxococcales bacterium]